MPLVVGLPRMILREPIPSAVPGQRRKTVGKALRMLDGRSAKVSGNG